MHIEIVTPKGAVLKTEADEITVPGVLGELGLFPGHIPIITALDVGEFTVKKGHTINRYVVDGGFLEIARDRVNVITETATPVDTLDLEDLRTKRAAAEEEMRAAINAAPAEAEAKVKALRRFEIMVGIAERNRH